MSHIDDMIRRVTEGEVIDWDQEDLLLHLGTLRLGEDFVDEMKEIINGGSQRYQNVESVEFFEDGQIKSIKFKGEGNGGAGTAG